MLLAILLSQLLYPPNDGDGFYFRGTRYDSAPDVILSGLHWRDGYIMGVWQQSPCNFQTFGVTHTGDVHFGQAVELVDGVCVASIGTGVLLDINPTSGHPSLVKETGYLYTQGSLGKDKGSKQANGELPTCGVTPYARSEPDGGCFLPYAGEHGDHTWGSRFPMYAGFLGQLYNPAYTGRNAYVAEWDYNGAFSQGHGLTLAQFPNPCPDDTYVTLPGGNIGTFMYGSRPGAIMWAIDTKHWYQAKCPVWEQLVEKSQLDALESRISALENLCQ